MILARYLIREVLKPFAVLLAILAALFGSYSAAGFLSDAVNGLLPSDTIALLIGLKVLISLEVLIPISLYIAVVLAFGRLYGDSEFTAMYALRVTPGQVMRAVLMLAGCLAVLVACLSLFARPWAYAKSHELSRRAQGLLNVGAMEAGTFYTGENGNRVIYLSHRDGPGSPARDVFVRLRRNGLTRVIYARLAYQLQDQGGDGSDVYLSDAHIYDFGDGKKRRDRVLNVEGIALNPNSHIMDAPERSAVAASSFRLMASRDPEDIAELEWRFSTPISTLLLGLLGVPLSRAQPRQGRYTKIGTAILVYSAYYLLCTSARTWVQHGSVPAIPGLWWAPGLLALVLAAAVWGPEMHFRYRRAWRDRWRAAAASNAAGRP